MTAEHRRQRGLWEMQNCVEQEAKAAGDLSGPVQSLPTELRDYIYDLTFSTGTKHWSALGEKDIDETYKPPPLLHMNRHIREVYAKQFYGNHDSIFWFSSPEVALKWLASLPKDHLEMIHHIRVPKLVKHAASSRRNPNKLGFRSYVVKRFRKSVRLVEKPSRFIDSVFEFCYIQPHDYDYNHMERWMPLSRYHYDADFDIAERSQRRRCEHWHWANWG